MEVMKFSILNGEQSSTCLPSVGKVRLYNKGNQKMYGKAMDVWALGCTFYQLIYNSFPFDAGMRPSDLSNSLINDEVKFPELSPGFSLPFDCADLIRKMLHKDPLKRITVAQILAHPFLIGSLAGLPDSKEISQANKAPGNKPMKYSSAFKKIVTQTLVDLQMKKKELQ